MDSQTRGTPCRPLAVALRQRALSRVARSRPIRQGPSAPTEKGPSRNQRRTARVTSLGTMEPRPAHGSGHGALSPVDVRPQMSPGRNRREAAEPRVGGGVVPSACHPQGSLVPQRKATRSAVAAAVSRAERATAPREPRVEADTPAVEGAGSNTCRLRFRLGKPSAPLSHGTGGRLPGSSRSLPRGHRPPV